MATVSEAYKLNSGMRCVKYMLLIISFMFAITSILVIMVGTTIQTIFGDFRQFIDDQFLSPAALLMATGIIMLFVAALGAFGAIKESVLLINLYGVSLFLIFILEVSAATAAFVLQGQIRGMLIRTMTESLYEYNTNEYVQAGVDFMQNGLECCGIFHPSDWEPALNPPNSDSTMISVPPSCCGSPTSNGSICNLKYESGCFYRLEFIISQSAMLIATGATTVAFVQLLGVVCAFMLAKTLRRNKSIREARRWQMQQSVGILIAGNKAVPSPVNGYQQLEKQDKFFEEYTANSPSVN